MARFGLGIRGKLILIFVLIKVVPLVALAWFAWSQMSDLGLTVTQRTAQLTEQTHTIVTTLGDLASEDSINALDLKARESIERLTTDTARQVAAFLHDRDRDILQAADLPLNKAAFERFLDPLTRSVVDHSPWVLNTTTDTWGPANSNQEKSAIRTAQAADNAKDFHSRPLEMPGIVRQRPLYHEMTFVDVNGLEKIKISKTELLPGKLLDVSKRANTFCKAETYFAELKKLKPGEVYVTEVIGPYVRGHVIGSYTRTRADTLAIAFEPEESGYAGKENPVGKRFQGIIRWAAPVVQLGQVVGYVTLALDHTHVMEFTDHIIPTEERYSPISDASSGNYAFMWDYKGRNISHPRDYFIVGYDPETGEPTIPWMDSELYAQFKESGMSVSAFQKTVPSFHEQSLKKKPAKELTQEGLVALDGRYLNFAPQCTGWHNLTQSGGSGSFVIFWSGLWKLTTAATIPYYTGIYGDHPRGFGYVTIGANVHEFHRAATETATKIDDMIGGFESDLAEQDQETRTTLAATLTKTARNLSLSTAIMIFIVILIAIWMASTLTRKITSMIVGVRRFQQGDMDARMDVESTDEIGQLIQAFNEMSDSIQTAFSDLVQAESKYRNIVEHAAAGIFQSSIHGRFLSVNPALAKMMGYDSPQQMQEEITNLREQFYVDPSVRDNLLRKLEHMETVVEEEFQAYRRDGSTGSFTTNTRFVKDENGDVLYIEGMMVDISDRMDKERAQRERELAEAANMAKSEFLARMSHEIRTPMNAVIGVGDLLEEYDLNHEQEMLVRLLKSSGDNLLSLIDDILDLSKIEAGKITINAEPFDLHEEIATLCSLLAHRAFEKDLELDYNIDSLVPRLVNSDQGRLRQVITNLIGNAIKFTRQGEILLTVSVLESTNAATLLLFNVSDTGIGIPEDKIDKVFESFAQVDSSTTRVFGGTGLGLAICKKLVELMGGTIRVESTLRKGSNFSFTLSMPVLPDDQLPAPMVQLDMNRSKILLAEDFKAGRDRMARILAHHQASVTEAANGSEALKAARDLNGSTTTFDLAFIDVRLGDMSGFDVARRLIRDENMTSKVYMLVTANNLFKDAKTLKELDLAGYLIKPVSESALLGVLQKHIAPDSQPVEKTITQEPAMQQRTRILVVDDAEDNQLIIEQYLKKSDYDFNLASNGELAVSLFSENTYDLVLMDMQMPIMDGYTATAKIRALEQTRKLTPVPIIALTAHAMAEDRQKCLDAGCDDYLAKPIRKAALLGALEKFLESKGTA